MLLFYTFARPMCSGRSLDVHLTREFHSQTRLWCLMLDQQDDLLIKVIAHEIQAQVCHICTETKGRPAYSTTIGEVPMKVPPRSFGAGLSFLGG
jgi:hypothetical protein